MATLIYYTDPAHGWLHVPAEDLARVGLTAADFSKYSYLGREGALYLEEDCDMQKYLQTYQAKYGDRPRIRESYSNRDSFVRGTPRNAAQSITA